MASWKKNGYRRTRTDSNGNKTPSGAYRYRKLITNNEVVALIADIIKRV